MEIEDNPSVFEETDELQNEHTCSLGKTKVFFLYWHLEFCMLNDFGIVFLGVIVVMAQAYVTVTI